MGRYSYSRLLCCGRLAASALLPRKPARGFGPGVKLTGRCASPDLLIAVSQWSLKRLASGRYVTRVVPASIIEATVPGASPSPAAPGEVIAILAVGISRFPSCAKDALAGVYGPGHRGSCQHRKKDSGGANQSEFRHAFLPWIRVGRITEYARNFRSRS
jgi:hypothetical protein